MGQHDGGRRNGGPARQRRRDGREAERQDRAKAEQAPTAAAGIDDLQVNTHEANNGNQILSLMVCKLVILFELIVIENIQLNYDGTLDGLKRNILVQKVN